MGRRCQAGHVWLHAEPVRAGRQLRQLSWTSASLRRSKRGHHADWRLARRAVLLLPADALWQHIAACSNEYFRENLERRVDDAHKRYKARRRANRALPKKTKRDIYHEVNSTRPFAPHELCRFVRLLIARAIVPNREKLAHHWRTTDEGRIGRGTFGAFLSRDRFMATTCNLHFNANKDPRARTDRAWKIRKVVEVLQKTFVRGYVAPSKLAFDEAILPSRSSLNKMRVYLKDKPHKWGTKLFMLCSAETAYCIQYVFLPRYICCIALCSFRLTNLFSYAAYMQLRGLLREEAACK